MDAIFAFFAGLFFSWWFWPIALVASLFFESVERSGFAVLTAILGALGIYGFLGIGDWSWYTLGFSVAIYVGGGFLHAIWRWYRYVDYKVEEFNKQLPKLKAKAASEGNMKGDTHDLEWAASKHKEHTNYRNRLETIAYWVLMWPISGLSHLFGDIVKLVQKTISKFFSGLFDRIATRANAKLDIDLDNPVGLDAQSQ